MTSDREQGLIAPRHRRRLLRPIIGSLLLTALAMLAVELTDDTVLRVPGLALMLLVAPLVAFRYGLPSGLTSVALVALYSVYYFSTPGQLLRYSDEDTRRLLAISTLSLILTLMIGALRRAVLAREVQLRRQLGFANAITGSLGEGVYAVDREDRLTFMNPAAELILGWGQAELLGESVHGTIHCRRTDGSHVRAEECPILEVLRTGVTYRSDDDVFTARDGTMFPVALTSSPIIEEGHVAGAVVAFRDLTERKRAEEQREELLAQAERALALRNQFLAIASHELKTPVTLLKGYTQLLRGQAEKQGETGTLKPLRVIDRQVERMNRLVDELLDASRIESGKIRFEMRPFSLNEALEEVIGEVRVSTPAFELRVDEQATHLWVVGDRGRIQQVMTNLLTNAVKYSGKRKEVDVSVRCEDDRAVVSITDYGIGIPEGQVSEVFRLYFRATNASVNNYGGLGMGLYISKYIIDGHGGTIGLASKEGQGSTFYFSLPLAKPVGQTGELAIAEV